MSRFTILAADLHEDAVSVPELLLQPTPISTCLNALIETLASHSDRLTSICAKFQAEIHCSGGFGIEPTVGLLNRLAAIGVRFDFACDSTCDNVGDAPLA